MILKKIQALEKTGNGYIVHGDCADVMLVFMSDDIVRIRVSFHQNHDPGAEQDSPLFLPL